MPSKELIEKVASHFEFPEKETTLVTAENILLDILDALQEPTEGMIEAGCDQYDFGDQVTQGEILTKEWRAMLAASALGEQSE